ncbi:hypothetical protein GCM10010199_16270 [Dactylosporangium roseum]
MGRDARRRPPGPVAPAPAATGGNGADRASRPSAAGFGLRSSADADAPLAVPVAERGGSGQPRSSPTGRLSR